MAQNNSGTKNSASFKNKKPINVRKQNEVNEKRMKDNYAKAKDGTVTLRNIAKTLATRTVTTTNRDKIKGYLQNIGSQGNALIAASRYLYYRSPLYAAMIRSYVNMYCLDCRKMEPKADLVKGLGATQVMKQYSQSADFMDSLSLENTMVGPITNAWIEDVSFNLYLHDDNGTFFYHIDASEAIIDTVYMVDGGFTFGMALDMSRWKSAARQELIESIGEPLTTAWKEYEKTGNKYVHIPPEYTMVLKVRHDLWDTIIPPLLEKFMEYASLADLEENQASADDLSFFKLLYLQLEVLSGARTTDEFSVSPDLAIDYFKVMQDEAIPKEVSSGVVPGELKVVDFSDTVSQDISRVEKAQLQILGTSGGLGALADAQKAINNTSVFLAAIRNDSKFALDALLGQIEAWTNMQLSFNVSNPCRIKLSKVTIHTREDYRKALLESCQYSFAMRLEYGTLMGYSEKATLLQMQLENEVFDLPSKMVYPLQSSYTQSGDNAEDVGRPVSDDDDLTPQGQRSRAKA